MRFSSNVRPHAAEYKPILTPQSEKLGQPMRIVEKRWQRAAVVASLLWIVVAGIWQRSALLKESAQLYWLLQKACHEQSVSERENCLSTLDKNRQLEQSLVWVDVAMTAFVPVLLVWIVGWIAFVAFRWIRAGK